jgi:large subunit ribosomal protein L34
MTRVTALECEDWKRRVEPIRVNQIGATDMAMHYPRRKSNVKRRRSFGFRARMKTKSGRKLLNKRRRIGRKIQTI